MKKFYFTLSFLLFIAISAFATEPEPKITSKAYYMCSEMCGDNTICHQVWVGIFEGERLVSYQVVSTACELNPQHKSEKIEFHECKDE